MIRLIASLLGVAALLTAAGPALAADEALYCWYEDVLDIETGRLIPTTLCRIAGHDDPKVYSPGDLDTPRLEHIDLSHDATGTECWYRTAAHSRWVLLGVDGNNVALVGFRPDVPGTVLDTNVIACTSEPSAGEAELEAIWEIVDRYIHITPTPAFSPAVGITGLETVVAVEPPAPVVDTAVSPSTGALLTVEIKVVAVTIDWGDGATDTYTESSFHGLVDGNGSAWHLYETKTCPEPGSARCHPSLSGYPIEVGYEWFVRWRRNSEPWNTLAVPDSVAPPSIYDVDEIVTRSVATTG